MIEDKQKIQMQMIDILALAIDQSQDRVRTLNIITYACGVGSFRALEDVMNCRDTTKEFSYIRQIVERF